jgi:thiol-disulfide isomerase/thioredoxin
MTSRWRSPACVTLMLALALGSAACGGSDTPTIATSFGPQGRTPLLPTSPTALPTFTVADFHRLTGQLRGMPLVVNIWASWCGPCVAEAPDLAQAARAYQGKVQFVGVDIQDELSAARAFVQRFGWPYPSVFDPAGAIRDDLGLIGQPHTVVFDAEGKQAYISSGPISGQTLHTQLTNLASADPQATAFIALAAAPSPTPAPAPANGTSGLGLLLGMAALALVVGSLSFLFLVRRFRGGVDPRSGGEDLGPPGAG